MAAVYPPIEAWRRSGMDALASGWQVPPPTFAPWPPPLPFGTFLVFRRGAVQHLRSTPQKTRMCSMQRFKPPHLLLRNKDDLAWVMPLYLCARHAETGRHCSTRKQSTPISRDGWCSLL